MRHENVEGSGAGRKLACGANQPLGYGIDVVGGGAPVRRTLDCLA
jgi:hypothetical protein